MKRQDLFDYAKGTFPVNGDTAVIETRLPTPGADVSYPVGITRQERENAERNPEIGGSYEVEVVTLQEFIDRSCGLSLWMGYGPKTNTLCYRWG